MDSEMDGTVAGEEKAEEKRQKDEKWAQFKDTHPRGAGNTMNRGWQSVEGGVMIQDANAYIVPGNIGVGYGDKSIQTLV